MSDISLAIGDSACTTWGWICFLDHHASIATLLGSGVTVLVALSGWVWALTAGWRDRKTFGALVRDAVDALIEATSPAYRLDAKTPVSKIVLLAQAIEENPVLPTLDYLVDKVPLERWPSTSLYISTRYLRDRVKVFIARAKNDSALPGWNEAILPDLVADLDRAIQPFGRSRGRFWAKTHATRS